MNHDLNGALSYIVGECRGASPYHLGVYEEMRVLVEAGACDLLQVARPYLAKHAAPLAACHLDAIGRGERYLETVCAGRALLKGKRPSHYANRFAQTDAARLVRVASGDPKEEKEAYGHVRMTCYLSPAYQAQLVVDTVMGKIDLYRLGCAAWYVEIANEHIGGIAQAVAEVLGENTTAPLHTQVLVWLAKIDELSCDDWPCEYTESTAYRADERESYNDWIDGLLNAHPTLPYGGYRASEADRNAREAEAQAVRALVSETGAYPDTEESDSGSGPTIYTYGCWDRQAGRLLVEALLDRWFAPSKRGGDDYAEARRALVEHLDL